MVGPRIGFLFPGQGAQFVGMGKEAALRHPEAHKLYEQADQILGYSLSRYCFEGPEEVLTQTLYAQPAIFVTSLALFSVLEKKLPDLKPDFVAGLSLGEFPALVAAGALSFQNGLKLVKARAESMEQAAQQNRGTMVSVIGLSQEQCAQVAKESGSEMANLNAPDQFVLSGSEPSISRASELAESLGAKRVIRLKVGGAFHSSLMEPARQRFSAALGEISIHAPKCFFMPNVTACPESDPERIRTLLSEQLTHPVRWIESMTHAKSLGIRRFIELGPGRALKGLAKRIDSSLEVLSFEKADDLEALESALERA